MTLLKKYDPQVYGSLCYLFIIVIRLIIANELLENTKAALERIKTSYQNLKHRKEASTNLTDNNQEWLEKMNESA